VACRSYGFFRAFPSTCDTHGATVASSREAHPRTRSDGGVFGGVGMASSSSGGGGGGGHASFDPYADLGLKRGATDEEVKSAFRRLARAYHPDAGGASTAESRAAFNRITSARNRLLYAGRGAGGAAGQGGFARGHGVQHAPYRPRVSNWQFAAVLTLPLCLMGVVSSWAFPSDHARAPNAEIGRLNGLMNPPVIPWLREDDDDEREERRRRRAPVSERVLRRMAPMFRRGDDPD